MDLVTLRTFNSEAEANIAKSALDAFGIHSMIARDDCGGQRPALTLVRGLRLIVRPEDRERAEEVLANNPGASVDES